MQTQVLRQTASEIHAILNMWLVYRKKGGEEGEKEKGGVREVFNYQITIIIIQ